MPTETELALLHEQAYEGPDLAEIFADALEESGQLASAHLVRLWAIAQRWESLGLPLNQTIFYAQHQGRTTLDLQLAVPGHHEPWPANKQLRLQLDHWSRFVSLSFQDRAPPCKLWGYVAYGMNWHVRLFVVDGLPKWDWDDALSGAAPVAELIRRRAVEVYLGLVLRQVRDFLRCRSLLQRDRSGPSQMYPSA